MRCLCLVEIHPLSSKEVPALFQRVVVPSPREKREDNKAGLGVSPSLFVPIPKNVVPSVVEIPLFPSHSEGHSEEALFQRELLARKVHSECESKLEQSLLASLSSIFRHSSYCTSSTSSRSFSTVQKLISRKDAEESELKVVYAQPVGPIDGVEDIAIMIAFNFPLCDDPVSGSAEQWATALVPTIVPRPVVEGYWQVEGSRLSYISAAYSLATEYTVSIPKGFTDQHEQHLLKKSYLFSFSTPRPAVDYLIPAAYVFTYS